LVRQIAPFTTYRPVVADIAFDPCSTCTHAETCARISLDSSNPSHRGKIRMNKVIAGMIVAFAAALGSLGLASPAQAYPDTPPTGEGTPPQVNSAAPDSEAAAAATRSAALPSTGGPDATLLGGGVALVLVGGAAVVVARRRQTS
jgi:LPXTG-motif cell wall-anchored protein